MGRRWSEENKAKFPEIAEVLRKPPLRLIVQMIITNAFRHYYYATGKSCSNKHEIANRMKQEVVNYRFQELLDIATKYKMHPDQQLKDYEIELLEKGYQEFRDFMDNNNVDAVPL